MSGAVIAAPISVQGIRSSFVVHHHSLRIYGSRRPQFYGAVNTQHALKLKDSWASNKICLMSAGPFIIFSSCIISHSFGKISQALEGLAYLKSLSILNAATSTQRAQIII